MTRAWTKRVLVGCFLAGPIACVVSTGDDGLIDEDVDGTSGSGNASGSGGSSGASGSGGSSAQGGSGGSLSMVENGGSAGSTQVPTPVCTAEAGDATDACLSCIKAQCCSQWQACNDSVCQQQREDLVECVRTLDAPDADSYADCVSMVSPPDMGYLSENAQDLFTCVTEFVPDGDAGATKSRCDTECFGEDIFFD
jgi:hypothetical protein